MYPKGGHPVYLPAELTASGSRKARRAGQLARDYMRMGLDGIKLSWALPWATSHREHGSHDAKAGPMWRMAQGKPVFAIRKTGWVWTW